MHLTPFADAADVNELQAVLAIKILPQFCNEAILGCQVLLVPEDRVHLPIHIQPLMNHIRHACIKHPLGTDILALRVHVGTHEAESDALVPLGHPQIEQRLEFLVKAIMPLAIARIL